MIKHMSYAIEGIPEIRDFLGRLDSTIQPRNVKSFWEATQGLSALLCPGLWKQFYTNAVEKIAKDPSYNGGRDWHVHGFFLCESTNFHFSVKTSIRNGVGRNVLREVDESERNILSTRTAPAILSIVSDRPCTFDVYAFPAGARPDVFDPSIRIEKLRSLSFKPWQRIDVNGPFETVDLVEAEGEQHCILELSMADVVSQRWEFDRRTGDPYGTVLVTSDVVVIMAMLAEFARFGYEPALGQAVDLLSHHDFNVRWAAIRCIASISPSAAMRWMQVLAQDPHPSIRASAIQWLNQEKAKEGFCHAT